jgi:hypothetical protein
MGRSLQHNEDGRDSFWLNNARLQDLAVQLANPTGMTVKHQWKPKMASNDGTYQKPDLQAVQDNPESFIVNSRGTPSEFKRIIAAALLTAAEVEEPVTNRPGYGQESFFYFYPLSPAVARFTGGELEFSEDKWLSKPQGASQKGVWENEEFGHGAHFKKAAALLFGEEVDLQLKQMRPLNYDDDQFSGMGPLGKIRSHAMMRIASEVGASSFYFWIMAHTTRDLQRHIMFPFEDELGHMIKFYAIYRWAFPELSNLTALTDIAKGIITQISRNNNEGLNSGQPSTEPTREANTSGGRAVLREKTWSGLLSQLELIGVTSSIISRHLQEWATLPETGDLIESTLTPVLAAGEPQTLRIRSMSANDKTKLYMDAFERLKTGYSYASPRSDRPEDRKAHNPIEFRRIVEELAGQEQSE